MERRTFTPAERRGIRALVVAQCSAFDSTEKLCLVGAPCPMLNNNIFRLCAHFCKAVLPLDTALEANLFGRDVEQKACVLCQSPFVPSGNRQKYCSPSCQEKGRRIMDCNRQKRRREKIGPNVTI